MTHGAPDYSNVRKDGFVFRIDDMAELAVRLGSIISYDRRGDVYWFYGFDDGIGNFVKSIVGANSAVNLSATIYEHPPFSCELVVSTDVGGSIAITRRLAIPKTTKVGFQSSFRITASVEPLILSFFVYDGTSRWRCNVYVYPTEQRMSIQTASGGFETIASNIPNLPNTVHFMHLKVVADIVNKKWVRIMLDDVEYDVSDYDMITVSSSIPKCIEAGVFQLSNESVLSALYLDNFIITVNE